MIKDILLTLAAIVAALAIFGIISYQVSRPRPPLFEGDGDDE